MKNVKYYYRLNFNLSWKNPAKVKLSAGETERQKGQQNPLQWWGDVSSCGRPVQRRSRSLPWPAEKITTDTSYPSWQNRRDHAPGNSPPFGERMAKHRSSKRKDFRIKMWACVTQSETALPGHASTQSMAGLPWVPSVPFPCAPWASPVSFWWLWGGNCGYPLGSAPELRPQEPQQLLQSSWFYWGIST